MGFTFDGPNRRIVEQVPTQYDMVYDVGRDLYSAWLLWLAESDNAKYALAFETDGGREIRPGLRRGAGFFLQFGWRVKLHESEHSAIFEGGDLFVQTGDGHGTGQPVLPATGFLVPVYLERSSRSLERQISTGSGLSPEQDAKLMSLPAVTLTAEQQAQLDAVEADTGVIRTIVTAIQAAQLTAARFISLTFQRANTVAAGKITEYRAGDEIDVAVTYDAAGVPVSEEPQP